VLFAGKAVIIKIAYRYGVDPATLIGLRMAYAAPLFALVAWWVDAPGGPGQRARALRARAPASAPESVWRRGDGWRITGLGLAGYYLASYLDFLGLQYVSVGLERVILYLNPTFVLLISLFWFKRRISGRQWLALAVSYAGVVLVFVHDVRTSGDGIVVGGLLVLASGLLYAVYLSAAGEMVSRLGSMRLTAWASLVSSAACVVPPGDVTPCRRLGASSSPSFNMRAAPSSVWRVSARAASAGKPSATAASCMASANRKT